MKKSFVLLTIFVMLICSACGGKSTTDTSAETASIDYGSIVETAKSEFLTLFSGREGLEITSTSTMARADDGSHIVVQISYSSKNGNGEYGFEMQKDESGNWEILQQGEDVTIDHLINQYRTKN